MEESKEQSSDDQQPPIEEENQPAPVPEPTKIKEEKDEKKVDNDDYDYSHLEYGSQIKVITAHHLYKENRVMMSKGRLFTYYDTGDYSLDRTFKSEVIKIGKIEYKDNDLKFYQMGDQDTLLYIDFEQKMLKCYNPVLSEYVDGWDQKIESDMANKFEIKVHYFQKSRLVAIIKQEEKKISISIFKQGQKNSIKEKTFQFNDKKLVIFPIDRQGKFYSSVQYFQNEPFKFQIWDCCQPNSESVEYSICKNALGYVPGAHLTTNGKQIFIYMNILINNIEDCTTSQVIVYDLEQNKEIKRQFIGGTGDEHNAMVLNVLGGTTDNKSILTLLGKDNDENLISYDPN